MGGKKMEGDAAARRARSRAARERGEQPSAAGATKGSSKQRQHLERSADHVEKLASVREGKQRSVLKGESEVSPRSRGARRRGVRSR